MCAKGRRVRLNWVPSHVDLRGNEAAREATRKPAVTLTVLPSVQRPRCWPDVLPPQLSRAEEVVLHRLRLGYGTLEELRDGFEDRPCEHCPHLARRPLAHYLLSWPATARLKQRVGPLEDAAALVLRQVQENLPLLLEMARDAPPPR
ncbi:hypothetical protein GWK47_012827 [Chionoecetes opilio]|uniref:RNase H type-1 domain-containing protein n=1 Tax=Chionoecetes opilio TaxID=41210 RepID=A0A8J4XUH2_CHIOP|nr:hypothetical protein GWK47_012827 [Chionoecetes opilio]